MKRKERNKVIWDKKCPRCEADMQPSSMGFSCEACGIRLYPVGDREIASALVMERVEKQQSRVNSEIEEWKVYGTSTEEKWK